MQFLGSEKAVEKLLRKAMDHGVAISPVQIMELEGLVDEETLTRLAVTAKAPFTLLSDMELNTIKAYDVWKEKRNYGKASMGVVRTTYLIDEDGIIIKAMDKVKAADNPQQMLEAI